MFTVAKRKVDGQDMVYQSLKFSNGLWALAELKIKPGSSTIGVSVCLICPPLFCTSWEGRE